MVEYSTRIAIELLSHLGFCLSEEEKKLFAKYFPEFQQINSTCKKSALENFIDSLHDVYANILPMRKFEGNKIVLAIAPETCEKSRRRSKEFTDAVSMVGQKGIEAYVDSLQTSAQIVQTETAMTKTSWFGKLAKLFGITALGLTAYGVGIPAYDLASTARPRLAGDLPSIVADARKNEDICIAVFAGDNGNRTKSAAFEIADALVQDGHKPPTLFLFGDSYGNFPARIVDLQKNKKIFLEHVKHSPKGNTYTEAKHACRLSREKGSDFLILMTPPEYYLAKRVALACKEAKRFDGFDSRFVVVENDKAPTNDTYKKLEAYSFIFASHLSCCSGFAGKDSVEDAYLGDGALNDLVNKLKEYKYRHY